MVSVGLVGSVGSVGVSKLGKTTLHCVNPGANVNGEYYRSELPEMMLPEMKILAGRGHISTRWPQSAHSKRYSCIPQRQCSIKLATKQP